MNSPHELLRLNLLRLTVASALTLLLSAMPAIAAAAPKVGTLEVIAELPIRPGNVAATPDGRVFATVHALDKKIELPADAAAKGSFIQDLAVDDKRGWIYLADISPPALLAVNIETGATRRFGGHVSLQPEPQARLHVGGKPTFFGGKPASVGVDPITLSKDGETLYFGAINGTHWYSIPTQLLRGSASDAELAAKITRVGRKPVSDGAATDDAGNHFFTNLNDNGIDRLDGKGKLRPLVRDSRLLWPDSVQFGADSWLYIAVNQLHTTKAFTGGGDLGQPPYRIMRVWTGTAGNTRTPR